jgi:hypothetical protein
MPNREERWSAEDRRRALELACEHGPTRASEVTGVPSGTIHSWRHRLARAAVAAAEVVQRDTGRTWDERRDRVVIDFADTLDLARTQLHAALKSGTTKAARDLVIVVGVLAEKCELFSGGPTARTESLSLHADARKSVDELLDELGAKRRRKPELGAPVRE